MPGQPPPTLFSLRHLIIVGASERRHSLGERLTASLLRTPFRGQITPVNLRRKTRSPELADQQSACHHLLQNQLYNQSKSVLLSYQ